MAVDAPESAPPTITASQVAGGVGGRGRGAVHVLIFLFQASGRGCSATNRVEVGLCGKRARIWRKKLAGRVAKRRLCGFYSKP